MSKKRSKVRRKEKINTIRVRNLTCITIDKKIQVWFIGKWITIHRYQIEIWEDHID